jgi:A/G-specific adenine glycosylase
MDNKPHYIVVAGVIWRKDGKILISKRMDNDSHSGCWEFPGGKIENNESQEEAIRREIKEELDIEVVVGPEFGRVFYEYENYDITLIGIHTLHTDGIPKKHEVSDFKWTPVSDVPSHNYPAANKLLFKCNWNSPPLSWNITTK